MCAGVSCLLAAMLDDASLDELSTGTKLVGVLVTTAGDLPPALVDLALTSSSEPALTTSCL